MGINKTFIVPTLRVVTYPQTLCVANTGRRASLPLCLLSVGARFSRDCSTTTYNYNIAAKARSYKVQRDFLNLMAVMQSVETIN